MTEKTRTYSEYINNISSMRVTMLSLLAVFSFTKILKVIHVIMAALPKNSSKFEYSFLFLSEAVLITSFSVVFL